MTFPKPLPTFAPYLPLIPSPIRTAIDAALIRAEERYGVKVLRDTVREAWA